MPKIKTRVTFNRKKVAGIIKAANNKALTVMGHQALEDVTQYVPIANRTLQDSGIGHSSIAAENRKYSLIWSAPYARYLWHGEVMYGNAKTRSYGPEKLSFTGALARAEWAEYAKNVHGSEWKAVYEAALRRSSEKEHETCNRITRIDAVSRQGGSKRQNRFQMGSRGRIPGYYAF